MRRWQQASYFMKRYARPDIPLPDPFLVVVDKVSERTELRTSSASIVPPGLPYGVLAYRRGPSYAQALPPRRATARVPAPLHTTPALTMTRWRVMIFLSS